MAPAPRKLLLSAVMVTAALLTWFAAGTQAQRTAAQGHQGKEARLMAELKRQTRDLDGARRDLDQLLQLHPTNLDLLQMSVLVDLQQGHSERAQALLKKRFLETSPGKRMDLGLLLADLHLLTDQRDQAAEIYRDLASESPSEARPLIALAMLRQEQGRVIEVQELLLEARRRRGRSAMDDPLIDALGARWALNAARTLPNRTGEEQGS
ncbi:MAG: hypothetical protein VXX57_00830 [Cyanobacteriota bacterium]|nr:hypothetical protein [Cyanobacteriota bacterium]